MRGFAVATVLVGCSSSPRPVAPDAAMQPDAPAYVFEHTTTDVLVTPMSVHWSQGDFVCGLESCPAETSGGVLSFAERTTTRAYQPYELDVAAVGSRQLADDDQQLFYTVGTALDAMFVKCAGGGCNAAAFSIPRRLDVGPAVDASNVYWADSADGTHYVLRAASRNGDGTDATVVLPTIDLAYPERARLVESGQQLWWINSVGALLRVPVTGGTAVSVVENADFIAAAGDVVLVSRLIYGNAPPVNELGTVGADGVYQPLVSRSDGSAARFITAAENAMWWSTGDGNIYSVPLDGGSVTTYAVQMGDTTQVFAVLPDRFLVDLTALGLRSVMR